MILHIIHAHDCPWRWAGEIERARSPEIDAHNILVHFLYKNISKMSWYTYAQNISRCTGSTLFPAHTFLCKVMAILCLTKFRFLYLANNLEKPLFSAGQLHRFGKWCSRSYIYKHNFNKIIWWCTFNSTLSPGFKAGLIEGPANHLRNLELAWRAC